MNEDDRIGIRKDRQWKHLEGRLCRVNEFTPLMGSKIEQNRVTSPIKSVPYASFTIESKVIPEEVDAIAFCTQKNDFESLWAAFKNEYYDPTTEDVLMFWTTQHYNRVIFKILSMMAPKMVVFYAKKGTFEKFEDVTWPKNKPLADILEQLGVKDIVYRAPPLQRTR